MTQQDDKRGNLNIEPAGPPPGSVSALRLEDGAAEILGAHVRSALTPDLPRVPRWFWFAGAAFWGLLGYGAYRALKATAPVLVPAALGLPPGTWLAMQQISAKSPNGAGPAPGAEPPLPAQSPVLEALLSKLGASSSATASALAEIANHAEERPSEAPSRRRPSATKTRVSGT